MGLGEKEQLATLLLAIRPYAVPVDEFGIPYLLESESEPKLLPLELIDKIEIYSPEEGDVIDALTPSFLGFTNYRILWEGKTENYEWCESGSAWYTIKGDLNFEKAPKKIALSIKKLEDRILLNNKLYFSKDNVQIKKICAIFPKSETEVLFSKIKEIINSQKTESSLSVPIEELACYFGYLVQQKRIPEIERNMDKLLLGADFGWKPIDFANYEIDELFNSLSALVKATEFKRNFVLPPEKSKEFEKEGVSFKKLKPKELLMHPEYLLATNLSIHSYFFPVDVQTGLPYLLPKENEIVLVSENGELIKSISIYGNPAGIGKFNRVLAKIVKPSVFVSNYRIIWSGKLSLFPGFVYGAYKRIRRQKENGSIWFKVNFSPMATEVEELFTKRWIKEAQMELVSERRNELVLGYKLIEKKGSIEKTVHTRIAKLKCAGPEETLKVVDLIKSIEDKSDFVPPEDLIYYLAVGYNQKLIKPPGYSFLKELIP